jgi:hypothetical protein
MFLVQSVRLNSSAVAAIKASGMSSPWLRKLARKSIASVIPRRASTNTSVSISRFGSRVCATAHAPCVPKRRYPARLRGLPTFRNTGVGRTHEPTSQTRHRGRVRSPTVASPCALQQAITGAPTQRPAPLKAPASATHSPTRSIPDCQKVHSPRHAKADSVSTECADTCNRHCRKRH